MTVLSFISMYILMYAMVDTFGNAVPNLNQWYMAGLMTAPMVAFEVLLMGQMYKNRKWNAAVLLLSVAALAGFWMLIRTQTGIGDREFLKSMIPHHAGAILMCDEADLKDPEVIELCRGIVSGQQAEIQLMRNMLEDGE